MDRRVWKRRNLFLLLQLGIFEEKKKIFLLTLQIYECEYWLHICKNICCNTEHLSRITCEFLLFIQKYSIHKTFIEAMDLFYPSISEG